MRSLSFIIILFLMLIISASAQIGPNDTTIVSFLGNAQDYNIQLVGDDEKIYSLPKGFLKDKLDKSFDYRLPHGLSKKYNYLVIMYTDWDRINKIQERLDTLRPQIAGLNFEGPESGNEDYSMIDEYNELEKELVTARLPRLYLYNGSIHPIFPDKNGYEYNSLVPEDISPSGRYLLFAVVNNTKYIFMAYDAAENKTYSLFTFTISGAHHANWINDDLFTLSYQQNNKARFFTLEQRERIKNEITLPKQVEKTGPVSSMGDVVCFIDEEFAGIFNIFNKTWKPIENPGNARYQIKWNRAGSMFGCVRKGGMGMYSDISIYYRDTGRFANIARTDTEAFFAGWLDNARVVYGFHDFMFNPEAEKGRGIFVYDLNKKKERQLYEGMAEDYPMLACPLIYFFKNDEYIHIGEILPGRVGKIREGDDMISLTNQEIKEGIVKLKISEKLAETSYIDKISVIADGKEYLPINSDSFLREVDNNYFILSQGNNLELLFLVPEGTKEIHIFSSGYYEPVFVNK